MCFFSKKLILNFFKMKTYIKFLCLTFFKSFFYVSLFLSLLNSPSMLFEMFPFIFLLSTQFFFIKLFNNNELEIFKYSGLKNSKVLWILSFISFLMSIVIITVFYNFSANLKNFY